MVTLRRSQSLVALNKEDSIRTLEHVDANKENIDPQRCDIQKPISLERRRIGSGRLPLRERPAQLYLPSNEPALYHCHLDLQQLHGAVMEWLPDTDWMETHWAQIVSAWNDEQSSRGKQGLSVYQVLMIWKSSISEKSPSIVCVVDDLQLMDALQLKSPDKKRIRRH